MKPIYELYQIHRDMSLIVTKLLTVCNNITVLQERIEKGVYNQSMDFLTNSLRKQQVERDTLEKKYNALQLKLFKDYSEPLN